VPGRSRHVAEPADAYWELEAELPAASEELWGLFCYRRGALGAELVQEQGARRIVRHSFASAPDAAAWQAAFAREFPDLPPPLRLRVRRLAVQAWETAWRAHFTPLRLGRRLLVTPPWETAAAVDPTDAARVRIVIDPGQGFGTGWHPSTALALEELEAALDAAREAGPPPARLLDVGTGSGILAIAGCLLGAVAALALDVDAVALPEARRNAALSGAPPPWLVQGRPDCLRGAFPLVVANIVAEVLLAHSAALAELTARGGCLILGGILAHERAALLEAYAAAGLRLEHERQREGWLALRLRRA
jgi:ribosomal protein L11 methyltransferase